MIVFLKYFNRIRRVLLVSALSLSVLSCGSETIVAAGISGTGIVFGSITGFGSIFVNGVEYEIDDANFDVDGKPFSGLEGQSNLQIGMVVKLKATTYDNGTGLATSVMYDDAVEGPVAEEPVVSGSNNNIKDFSVLGQSVRINKLTTRFNIESDPGFGFDSISIDDVVEVSGFVDIQTNQIIATHVEKKGSLLNGDNEVQLHGVIENLSDDKVSFRINGILINRSEVTDNDLEDIDTLAVGLYVEVKGVYQGGVIFATNIEGEDDDRAEIPNYEGYISLEGIVSNFTSSSVFSVNGVTVFLDTGLFPVEAQQVADGVLLEVDGEMQSGILQVSKIEIESDGSDDHDDH